MNKRELDKFLDENLSSGRIWPSKSPMASPFFFVKKKDGKLRPVQDYCKAQQDDDQEPLSTSPHLRANGQIARVPSTFPNSMSNGATTMYASRLVMSGRQPLEPTEVYSNQRSMFFGLTNSPTTFQWMMNDIFKDLIASSTVTVYLDDILIMSKTKEEHRRITREVLKVL